MWWIGWCRRSNRAEQPVVDGGVRGCGDVLSKILLWDFVSCQGERTGAWSADDNSGASTGGIE